MNLERWWPGFQSCVQTLSPERLADLGQFYAPEAQFQDPFQRVQGREAILHCYAAMFSSLHQPHFHSLALASRGPDGSVAVRWVFGFSTQPRAPAVSIPGTSWLHFDADGLIMLHEDHWDASLLLDAFPVIGGITRLVKRRIARHAQSSNRGRSARGTHSP